jgi:hypothetical protein
MIQSTAKAPKSEPPSDPSIPLCEVLEQEYLEITGKPPDQPPDWSFTPEQIIEPRLIRDRLMSKHDRASLELATGEFRGAVEDLSNPGVGKNTEKLRLLLSERLNELLDLPALYDPNDFKGVKFRSQTMDRIAAGGPTVERNRLILEDTFPGLQKIYDIRLAKIYRKIHDERLAALCLSGGGIRSATFALGVVQGLARNGLLDKFHYLSTVSGGGFLGGWLSAWISRSGFPHVIRHLRDSTGRPLEPEAGPIAHLRSYSNYLSPKLGLLSADTWTLVATYLRNLFLTSLVFIPPLIGLLVLPSLLVELVRWAPGDRTGLFVQAIAGAMVALAGIWCGVRTVKYVHENRPLSEGPAESAKLHDTRRNQRAFLRQCLAPLVGAMVATIVGWAWLWSYAERFPERMPEFAPLPILFTGAFAGIGALVHLIGWLLTPGRRHAREGAVIVGTGALAGLTTWFLASQVPQALYKADLGAELFAWLAVPAFLLVVLVFGHVYLGWTSNKQVDAVREWSARYSAWILIVVVAWVAGFGVAVMGPVAVRQIAAYLQKLGAGFELTAKSLVGAVGAISGMVTLWAGHSAGTAAKADSRSTPAMLALAVAAPVFILIALMSLAGVGAALGGALGLFGPNIPATLGTIGGTFFLGAGLILFGMIAATRVDTNKFSLHAMYRARLIRAYLGASREAGERDPNPFTGFDEKDNLSLRDLRKPPESGGQAAGSPGKGPLHVVNVALNLVGGTNLAWRQRKAESFTMSPLHCGTVNLGFRPTQRPAGATTDKCYGGKSGISLGTAITISGAAASPNMGYHSSAVISFVLMLFNVRLGWWLGNPGYNGREVYERSSPTSSLSLILDEALGKTDDKNSFVYLSDGGHFENLGLYEMVVRRCHTIVVSDAGCDPAGTFEDLGNAIRKIRVDLGIPISFRAVPIHARSGDGPAPAGSYCAVGTIEYSKVDGNGTDGTLIYIKPAYYGCEPTDVLNYARTTKAFPHESTADQFFSESQFESYRALGSYVIDRIFKTPSPSPVVSGNGADGSLDWFVEHAREYVEPSPPPAAEPAYTMTAPHSPTVEAGIANLTVRAGEPELP